MTNASPGFRNFPETGAIFLPEGERPGRKQKKKVRRGSQKAVKGRTAYRLYGFRKKVGPVGFANGAEKSDGSPGEEGEGGRARRTEPEERRGGCAQAALFSFRGAER